MKQHQLAIVYAAMEQVHQHPDNANNGDLDALEDSVDENGFYSPIIAQRSTGNILAGNHRYLDQLKRGVKTIPVIWLDVTDEEALRIMVADNRVTRLGYDDEAQLSNVLLILHDTDRGLAGTGYDNDQLTSMIEELNEPLEFEPEEPDASLIGGMQFSIYPIVSEDGKVYELTLAKTGARHVTAQDLNGLRRAMGMEPLSAKQLATYDVPGWMK